MGERELADYFRVGKLLKRPKLKVSVAPAPCPARFDVQVRWPEARAIPQPRARAERRRLALLRKEEQGTWPFAKAVRW